jgi:hypothetical protein
VTPGPWTIADDGTIEARHRGLVGQLKYASPEDRAAIEQLARVAELQVAEVTGRPVDDPVRLEPLNRAPWARRFLDDERPLLGGPLRPRSGVTPAYDGYGLGVVVRALKRRCAHGADPDPSSAG